MHVRNRRLLTLVSAAILGCVALAAAGAAEAKGKKSKHHDKHPAPSNNGAGAAKADAERADAMAANAQGQASQLNSAVRTAEQAVTEAVAHLQKIEEDLIRAQPAASEFGKARDAYDVAKREYQEAKKSGDTSDAALAEAKKKYDAAKEVYQPLRKKLIDGDSDWGTANDDLKEKRKTLADLKRQLDTAAGKTYRAIANARDAEAMATAASTPVSAVGKGGGKGNGKGGGSGKGGKGCSCKKH